MPRLNQLIAVANGKKSSAKAAISAIYQRVQKTELTTGLSRVYRPKDDEGEQLPPERKNVQYTARQAILDFEAAMVELFNAVGAVDRTNCEALADIKVGEKVICTGVPVTHLLFLEKQLVDLHTFVEKLPVLDPAEKWEPEGDFYKSEKTTTTRTKKVPRNHVMAEATDKHPAQVQVYHEDILVGYWDAVRYAGGIPTSIRAGLLDRIKQVQEAVKFAREEANSRQVVDLDTGDAILGFVFAK